MGVVQSLTAGAFDALFIADAGTGIIIFANEAAARLFETTTEDLVGRHQTALHPKEDLLEVSEKFKNFVASDDYKEVEARILTNKGKIKPVLISGALRYEEAGRVFSVAFFKDMTSIARLSEIATLQTNDIRSYAATIKSITSLFKSGFANTDYLRQELLHRLHETAAKMDIEIRKVASMSRLDAN